MARASESEQTGSIGLVEAMGKFGRIGFGYAEIVRHDNGTDVFLLARDSRRFDLGLTLAAQVKGGKYWFRRPKRAKDKTVLGWWFTDPTGSHTDDWVNHGLPHLLVIHNIDEDVSYWVHVRPDNVESTGKGTKILVPADQRVDADSRDALVAIASASRPSPQWEGSAWRGAESLPRRDVLRHALLAPRLIAPHPNGHIASPLTAVQATAMALQARIADLQELEKHSMVMSVQDAEKSDKWRWNLYAAVHTRVTTGDVEALRRTLNSATKPAERAAAAAAAAGCLFEDDRADDAVAVLKQTLNEDTAGPVDHAWLTVQLARAYAQIGRAAKARKAAARALQIAVTHANDVTATAIAGVAASILLALQDWSAASGNDPDVFSRAIEASDTAVTWWRQQVAGWATAAAIDREFISWSRDRTRRWSRWDAANDQLLAASLNATLVGDHGQRAALARLLGEDTLLRCDRNTDIDRVQEGLSTLRIAGAHQDLALAVRRVVEDGPAEAAAAAAREIRLDSVTHTTAQSSLVLLRAAGRVLDEQTADSAAGWILNTLTDDTVLRKRVRPSFTIEIVLIETLASVLQSAGDEIHRRTAAHVTALPPMSDDLLSQRWAQVVANIASAAWTEEQADAAAARQGDDSVFRDTLLARLASHGTSAREAALAAIRNSPQPALSAWGHVGTLPDDVVDDVIESLAESLRKRREEAAGRKGHTGWAFDDALAVTILNLHHPTKAKWEPLIQYLSDSDVPAEDRARSFGAMAGMFDRVPAEHAAALRAAAGAALGTSDSDTVFGLSNADVDGRLRLFLAAAAGDEELPVDLVGLLGSEDQRQRTWAARMTWYQARGRDSVAAGVLISLIDDPDPQVRATAAAGLVSLPGDDRDPLTAAALERALQDRGATVPMALASRVAEMSERSPEAARTLARLQTHPFKPVRALVQPPAPK